jgi:hypothetical protein
MASEVLFAIWQGGQLAIPVRTTFLEVKTNLGADYTLVVRGVSSRYPVENCMCTSTELEFLKSLWGL